MKSSMSAFWRAAACVCAMACAHGSTAFAAEPEPISTPVTFRFGGGERIKLIVSPESVGSSIEQIVSDDGFIALPTGGEPLNIKGKTRFEVQKLAAERIQKDSGVIKATADVALLSVPTRSVYVGGEGVKLSQSIPIMGTAPLTLYAALLASGGVSAEGDPTHVSVSRTDATGHVKTEIYDVSKFGDANSKTLGPVLESGDVVKVSRGETFILAGEVIKPGTITRRDTGARADSAPRVSNAIYATGGLKTGANRKAIKILRQDKDGNRRILTADLDAAENTTAKAQPGAVKTNAVDPDPVLQDGDVVVVSATGGIPVLGKVRVPGVYPINGQSIKLSRIIATAGGFAEFAKSSAVIVVKANNPYGSIHIDMSLIQKGGFQDMELEEGDLVYVPERLL